MLDADLAELYGVETRTLVQAIKRQRSRFPDDFMFRLTKAEFDGMKDPSTSAWRDESRGTASHVQGVRRLRPNLVGRILKDEL